MPARPLRLCAHTGCTERVTAGRCTKHARQVDLQRGTSVERGYDKRWRQRARLFLRRHPLCGQRPFGLKPVMSRCFDEGRTTLAGQVDHVVPHKGDPVLFNDERNLQSLCRSCGSRKSQAGL